MKSDKSRNLYMLKGPLAMRGYDWWWHSFTAFHAQTRQPKQFFVEYYVCNPKLGEDKPVLGQLHENQKKGRRPSYVMIKVGCWGDDARQIHNFYAISDLKIAKDRLELSVGECFLSETRVKGYCNLTSTDMAAHPEYMADAGTMSWDLHVEKKIPFNVGYGASRCFRRLNIFEMFWHVEGMKTLYSGEVVLDGQCYVVQQENSWGYADKNWGRDFTSPWLWLNSCNMTSMISHKQLQDSAFVIGGGNPKVLGKSVGRKLLGSLYYEGKEYEYNFSKFWTKPHIEFSFKEEERLCIWNVLAENRTSIMSLVVRCRRDEMLLINYEAPDGVKRHNKLFNGGTGEGELMLYKKEKGEKTLIDHIAVHTVGCEYGEYDQRP